MARTKPPRLPEEPPAILRDPELRALLGVCEADKSFAGIRDATLVRIFLDTGARRAEISNLRYDPSDDMANDIDPGSGHHSCARQGPAGADCADRDKTIRAIDRYLRLRSKHLAAAQPWLWLGLKGRLTDSGIAQRSESAASLRASVASFTLTSSGTPTAHQMLAAGMQEDRPHAGSRLALANDAQRYAASTLRTCDCGAKKLSPGDRL